MNEVAVQVQADRAVYDAAPSMTQTPMQMLASAVASGASPEMIGKLMDLQERWEKNEALKDFNAAIADAKAEIKPIVRNRTGHNQKRYADMAAVANGVDAILAKHGLSYRHRSKQDEKIHVTCILFHRSGHSEETTLAAKPDTSGSKNDVQAIGSTATYLERYTLQLALGLAAADDDDGAAAGAAAPITELQVEELRKLILEIGGAKATPLLNGFLKKFKIEAIDNLPASEFRNATDALNAKRGS